MVVKTQYYANFCTIILPLIYLHRISLKLKCYPWQCLKIWDSLDRVNISTDDLIGKTSLYIHNKAEQGECLKFNFHSYPNIFILDLFYDNLSDIRIQIKVDPSNIFVSERGVFPMVGHVSTNQSTDKNQRVYFIF